MVSNNLYFFDKNGESLSLQINPDSGAWEGTVYFDQLSVALFDNENLFILEKVGAQYKFPTLSPGQSIEIKWEDSINSVFFLYDVTKEVKLNGYFLDKKEFITIHYDDILPTSDGSNIDIKLPLQVNVAFNPDSETEFTRTLNIYLKDDTSPNTPQLLAKIGFYGEGEYQDDRFRMWLENFGIKFNRADANILANYDIKEAFPDWKQINETRKMILVNQQEIYPYIGTYKGLVNFIDMLGYKDALHVQEYWKNVNKNSQYYNKLFLVDLKDILDDGKIDNINLLNENKNLKFGKQFAKTEFLALTYEFTKATDEFDDDGIPEVVETTEFTVDEIFYKLHMLSEKVKNEIIPVNVIIKDIIGEFVYFQKMTIKFWRDDGNILDYNLNEGDRISCDPDGDERLTLRALDPMYRQEYKQGVNLGVVQFNESYPDPYEFAQYYGPGDVDGIIDYIEEYYNVLKDERYPNIGSQLSWDFGDDPDKKIGAPVVLSMDIDKFTFKTFRGVTWQDVGPLGPGLPIYWTLQNLDFRNIYEITWRITKPTPNPYNFKYRGKAIDFHKLPHFLPYAGEYTVHLDFHTFNGDTIPFTKQVTVDDAKRPEIIAFSRLEDKFDYRINNLGNVQLGDFGASTFYYPRVNVIDNEDTNFDIYKNVMEWESFFQNRYGTGKNIYDVDLYDTTTNTYVPYNDPLQNHPKQDYWGLGSYTAPFKLKDFEGMTFDDAYFMRLSDLIYQGDFNAGFYMTTPRKGDTVTISLYSPFVLPGFSSLQDLANKLNASEHPGIRLFNYEVIDEKIHAQAEYFSKEMYHILYMPCPEVSPGHIPPIPPCEDKHITYVAGSQKKVHKLINFTGDWIDVSPDFPSGPLPPTAFESLYLDIMTEPNKASNVVVCGISDHGDESPLGDYGGGIRVSNDAGENWFQPGGDWKDEAYVFPWTTTEGRQWNRVWWLNSKVIYAIGVDGYLVKSVDAGLTFNMVSYCPAYAGIKTWCDGEPSLSFHVIEGPSNNASDDIIVVIRDNFVYKSTDSGLTWTTLNSGNPLAPVNPCGGDFTRESFGIFISKDQQTLIAGCIDWIGEIGGIFKSTDGGTTFNVVFDWFMDFPSVSPFDPDFFFLPFRLAWNPTSGDNIDHFWVTCAGTEDAQKDGILMKSTDEGDTWEINHLDGSALPVDNTNAVVAAHFHTTTDGYTTGLGTVDAPDNAIKQTSDGGDSLAPSPNQPVPSPIDAFFAVWTGYECEPAPEKDLYITYSVGMGKAVNKLVDLKGDWIDITPIFPGGDPLSKFDNSDWTVTYADVKSDPNDPTKVVVCGTHDIDGSPAEDFGAGIRVSHDAGESWFQPGGDWLDVINPDTSPASSWCKAGAPCIIFNRAWYLNSNVIYVISSLGDILKSVDGGLTFNIASHIPREINVQPCRLWLINLDTCIHAVEGPTSNTDDDIVVVGIENKIYKSSDGGSTWITLNGGSPLYSDPLVECPGGGSSEPIHTLNDVFISKDEQTIMVLGANEEYPATSPWNPEGGVFKSIDSGATFSVVYDLTTWWLDNPALNYWPWRLTWNPSHDGNIDNFWVAAFGVSALANGSDLILHSSDGGDNWTSTQHPSILPAADFKGAFSAAFHSATDGFIGGTIQPVITGEPAIRRTSDAGVTLIDEAGQVPYTTMLWLGMWTGFKKGSGGGSGGGSPLSPGCQKGDKYTFFHPRGAYSRRLVDYLKATFPPFDEETLFLFAKTSDMISGAVQDPHFWVDTDYWRYKDDKQRGFLPTTIDENAFSITRIKMFNERFEIPRYAPMFFIIDNLDAKQVFIWTLTDQITGEEIIKVKGVPFFVWKFKDLGKFTLSVEVIDSANTAYYRTFKNLITVSDKISYTKNVERKLNDRKIKRLSS